MKKILITGQTGRGKTLTALGIIKKNGLEPVIITKENFMSEESLEKKILTSNIKTIFGQDRAILIEDVHEMTQKRYIQKINKILSKTKTLIILTMIPTNTMLVREYKKVCEEIKLKPLLPTTLIEIIKKELNKNINFEQAASLLKSHNHDIRSIIIDLKINSIEESIKINTRNIELNVTELLAKLKYEKNPQKRIDLLFEKNIEVREIMLWMLDNTKDKNILSMIDIYEKRIINHQEFSFRRLQNQLLAHVKISENFVFPKKLLALSKRRQKDTVEKKILEKINQKIYASRTIIKRDYLPYLMMISSPS